MSELRSKGRNKDGYINIFKKQLEDLFTESQGFKIPIILPRSEVSKTEKPVTLPRTNKLIFLPK